MNVRLVAYRKATTGATSDSTYQLDLQEAPNISLNFQFSDIKEPETRKGSYTQTFKLPFTDNNNEFFQNWFNVNLTTLVFSTRKKFNAVLYVGTVPQFDGFIQLKAVYKKAQCYEIVLMSNTSDLFSAIGEQRLKDVFLNENGSYSTELNHTFNETNLLNSWNGGSSAFQNTSGVSLRDTDVNVQKVMYPTSLTKPNFYYDPNDTTEGGHNKYLLMDSGDISGMGVEDALNYIVPLTQFRPSIQIKTLFKLILARAGFSYTSNFIDGSYFGKIYMTTGNELAGVGLPTLTTQTAPEGSTVAGQDGTAWGEWTLPQGSAGFEACHSVDFTIMPISDVVTDDTTIWSTTANTFTKIYPTMETLTIRHKTFTQNLKSSELCDSDSIKFDVIVLDSGASPNVWSYITLDVPNSSQQSTYEHEYSLDITAMPVGSSARILMRRHAFEPVSLVQDMKFNLCTDESYTSDDLDTKLVIDWGEFNQGIYGATIDVPACIDSTITQKAFLKDLIERFNLVVIADPDDASNIIIEPYNDYLSQSTLKDWTNKLDTSKEIIVKDTTSIQKKNINLTDLEDVDLCNKIIKEEQPNANVFGHLNIQNINNDFATGEMANKPIFSPYINQKVFRGDDNLQDASYLVNMAVQYEFTYTQVEGGYENPTEATKPKLYWYNGLATTVKDSADNTKTYYLHHNISNNITAYSFTTYPVCTPFDITPSSDAYTLTQANKSLYWNSTPPIVGELDIFNYTEESGSWFPNTLYGYYWKQYLDNFYSEDARIMDCYLNLNEVDVFNFKFNDEVFIKDTYWRIIEISNYQVGEKASTKVKLLKSLDTLSAGLECNYVLGQLGGTNTWWNNYYYWCPSDDAGCTPVATVGGSYLGLYAPESCCIGVGGYPESNSPYAAQGLYLCGVNAGSIPIRYQNILGFRTLFNIGQVKSIFYEKLGGLNKPLMIGTGNTKYATPLINSFGNDIAIKYTNKRKGLPPIEGESHRMVLTGFTDGNTRGYSYPEGTKNARKIYLPPDCTTIIRVKGTATVVGGTSSTYVVGYTEGFAYYTAFKNISASVTQLSTAGGQQEFSIREGANPTTCTLYISTGDGGELKFGLDDSQTDTKRVWSLSVDIDVQQVYSMGLPHDENWALYQNGENIQFQNYKLMIWN
tara:strand:- start:2771 stop:6211 length:3441 start_codon:yes stop_codon:yes gene_type:complete